MRKEIIGNCELYLGDCMDIIPILGVIDTVVTDPPYGMNFQSNYRNEKYNKIKNDDSFELLKFICEIDVNHSKYIFCRWEALYEVHKPKSYITWLKDNHSMGDLKHEHGRQTEQCLFYQGINHFFPNLRPTDYIKCPRTGNELHPTQKPIDLMKVIVSWTDGVVVDPFMGSGTTGVACQQMGRKFIGIEKEPEYFDIACKRIEETSRQKDLFI